MSCDAHCCYSPVVSLFRLNWVVVFLPMLFPVRTKKNGLTKPMLLGTVVGFNTPMDKSQRHSGPIYNTNTAKQERHIVSAKINGIVEGQTVGNETA